MFFLRALVVVSVVLALVCGATKIFMFALQKKDTHVTPNIHRDPTLCWWFGESGFVFVHRDCFNTSIPIKQELHFCQSIDEHNTCHWGCFMTHEPVDTHIRLTTMDSWSGSRLLQYTKRHSLTVFLNICTIHTHTLPCKNWIHIGTQPDCFSKRNH